MFGPRTYAPADHDFFDEVVVLFVNLASFNAATESFWNSANTKIPSTPDHTLNLYGRVTHASFPIHGLMHQVVRNTWPSEVSVTLFPAATPPSSIPNGIQLESQAIANMIAQLVGTTFLKYYERNAHRPRTAFPSGPKGWPEVWRFAWLLRNAIAHRDRWSLNDATFPPTNWHDVRITTDDSDQPWFDIRRYIGGGDVLLLMEELNASSI